MKPDDKYEEYEKYAPIWERVSDFCDGEDSVKSKREEYLPKLPSQMEALPARTANGRHQTLYDLFLEKATVWPGASKTLRAYTGILNNRDPEVEVPPGWDDIFSMAGEDIYTVATWCGKELIKSGLLGLLIDYPAGGVRPYAVKIRAKDIINYQYAILKGKRSLVYLALVMQWYKGEPGKIVTYKIVEQDGAPACLAEEWEKTENSKGEKEWVLVRGLFVVANDAPIDYIPFVPMSEYGTIIEPDYPLILDVVNLNKAHYQNDAEYRNALTFAGRPTPCVAGLIHDDDDNPVIQLGTSTVLQFEPGGSWGMLGLDDASGINAIRQAGEDLKKDMALAGSRALMADPAGVEAAETARIHKEGEHGQLSTVAKVVSDGMTKALMIMANWAGIAGDFKYRINPDFSFMQVDPSTLTSL